MGLFGRDEKDPKEPAKDPLKDYRPAENRPQSFEPKTDPKTVTMGQAHVTPAQPPAAMAAKEPAVSDREKIEGGEGDVQAYLGKGSRVSGKLNFEGTVRVDGQVEGEIAAQDTLIVGERAVVTAQISGTTIIIRGKVTGDINARKRVEIRAPGRLFGNIVTPSLVIHEGVIFEGHCSMASGAEGRSAEAPKVSSLSKDEKGGNGVLARIASEATK
jgi:cytoskeletal protein CcmA (bactofilin family)